jgi:hypothetical protein
MHDALALLAVVMAAALSFVLNQVSRSMGRPADVNR